MDTHIIGEISLSISFFLYILYFLPQLWHNHANKGNPHLSFWLQLIYVLGYSADWIYGYTAHLPWQYRWVTLIGIFALIYQHWQMKPLDIKRIPAYFLLTTAVVTLFTFSFLFSLIPRDQLPPVAWLGTLSVFCFALAFVPQLIHNHQTRNGAAISHVFIGITIACAVLDFISAICLQWPWPSLVAPPLLITLNAYCWLQQRHFRRLPINFY